MKLLQWIAKNDPMYRRAYRSKGNELVIKCDGLRFDQRWIVRRKLEDAKWIRSQGYDEIIEWTGKGDPFD